MGKKEKNLRKRFLIGDLHGSYLALVQVLERCGFDYENDELITIGDIVDGWQDSFMVVEELLKIKNRIDIMGNHDNWFRVFIESGIHGVRWGQGGLSTAKSYAKAAGFELMVERKVLNDEVGYLLNLNSGDIPESHKTFFKRQHHYYKDEQNNLFIHGGFNRYTKLRETLAYSMMWDRHLWRAAMESASFDRPLSFIEEFNQIFIGHTATTAWGTDKPMHCDIVWNVDTGAGGGGKLTIMNIDTNEYFQSDLVKTLYPNDPHNIKM
jgi:serine/threonine protein phosphatase 1